MCDTELSDENIIESSVRYDPPPEGRNMAQELMYAMRRFPDRVLMVDAGSRRQWTGSELREAVVRIATGFVRQVGVKPNDVVLTMCDHTAYEIIMAFAVILAGGALMGTEPSDGYEEIKTLCELVAPDVIVTQSHYHDCAVRLKQTVPGLARAKIVWLDNPLNPPKCHNKHHDSTANNNNISGANNNDEPDDGFYGHSDIDRYMELVGEQQVTLVEDLSSGQHDEQLIDDIIEHRIDASAYVLTYMLTSGSTGRAKIVASTHEELMHGLYSMISASKYAAGSAPDGPPASERARVLMPVGPDSVFSGDLPLDHGAGINTMFLSVVRGAKLVVMKSYEEEIFWQSVHEYRITDSISSTTFGYKLLAHLKAATESGRARNWDLTCFRFMACAGSKLAFEELVRETQRAHAHLTIVQFYGATEVGMISMLPVADAGAHLASVGYLCPGLRAKLARTDSGADSGAAGAAGERSGELLLWARSKFKGYRCGRGVDAARVFAQCHDANHFYRTGDQVQLDGRGRLFVCGRLKDTLFLMEDWKILPGELEQLVDEHPLVEMSVVVGVADPQLPGCHAPRAFCKLVARSATQLARVRSDELRARLAANDLDYIARHITAFVARRAATPKHLRGGVRFVDEFPRVGLLNKVDRKVLAALA